jgi:hypothetical protein
MSGFPRGGGGGGSGTISTITSTSGTLTVSNPGGPITDLEQAVLSYPEFTVVTTAISLTAASWNLVLMTAGSLTITLPPAPAIGDEVIVSFDAYGTTSFVVAGNTGQTINGSASLTFARNLGTSQEGYSSARFKYVATNLWILQSSVGSDGGVGLTVSGGLWSSQTLFLEGLFREDAGVMSTNHAAFSSPVITSGVAFTPNAGFDTVVQINLAATTLGSLTVTYGPTTGAENTWCPTSNVVAGSDLVSTLFVPATWKVVATATGVTVALSASVHRI